MGITVFDKSAFVESVIAKELRLHEIIREAREEIARTDSRSIRASGSSDHMRFLRALVFFLQSGDMPNNVSEDDFQLLLPLAQHLVDRDGLSPDVLELVGE